MPCTNSFSVRPGAARSSSCDGVPTLVASTPASPDCCFSPSAAAPDSSTDQSFAALGPLTPSVSASLLKCGHCITLSEPLHTEPKASRNWPCRRRTLALKHRNDMFGATVPSTILDTTSRSMTPLFSHISLKRRWPSNGVSSTEAQSSIHALRPSRHGPDGSEGPGEVGLPQAPDASSSLKAGGRSRCTSEAPRPQCSRQHRSSQSVDVAETATSARKSAESDMLPDQPAPMEDRSSSTSPSSSVVR
mmetsp:Transcript_79507/g.233728  ORF Transcript_79507/g.233728 Transcript_79507/m.233728 type:complete len:247 (-) Transcript_79507:918-1658(-)